MNELSLIPEPVMARLMALKDSVLEIGFEIGRITNDLYVLLAAERGMQGEDAEPIRKMWVYALVGRIVGKAAASVRRYASVAAFYEDKEWEPYEALPFSHLAYAAQFPDSWQSILDTSMDYTFKRGLPPPLELLNEMRVLGIKGDAIPERGFLPQVAAEASSAGDLPQPPESHLADAEQGFLIPDEDEETDPEAAQERRKKQALEEVRAALGKFEKSVGGVSAALEKAENFPELNWARAELSQIVVRMRRLSEGVAQELGIESDGIYLSIPE